MMRHTLKILHYLLQDFQSVSDHFGTLCINGLSTAKHKYENKNMNKYLLRQKTNIN